MLSLCVCRRLLHGLCQRHQRQCALGVWHQLQAARQGGSGGSRRAAACHARNDEGVVTPAQEHAGQRLMTLRAAAPCSSAVPVRIWQLLQRASPKQQQHHSAGVWHQRHAAVASQSSSGGSRRAAARYARNAEGVATRYAAHSRVSPFGACSCSCVMLLSKLLQHAGHQQQQHHIFGTRRRLQVARQGSNGGSRRAAARYARHAEGAATLQHRSVLWARCCLWRAGWHACALSWADAPCSSVVLVRTWQLLQHACQQQRQHHSADVWHQLHAARQGSSGRSRRAALRHAHIADGVATSQHRSVLWARVACGARCALQQRVAGALAAAAAAACRSAAAAAPQLWRLASGQVDTVMQSSSGAGDVLRRAMCGMLRVLLRGRTHQRSFQGSGW